MRCFDWCRFSASPFTGYFTVNATPEAHVPPGSVWDDPPRLTLANVRPYGAALLLHRGRIKKSDLQATLVPHCNVEDLKVGSIDPFDGVECDDTRLVRLIDGYLEELRADGMVSYSSANSEWVLATAKLGIIVQWAITLNGSLPPNIRQYVNQDTLDVNAET